MNDQHLYRKLGISLLAGALLVLPSVAALAAPGVIANAPLFAATDAPPNIMFMIDNSGSMKNVVAQSPYDSSVDYTPNNCGNSSVSGSPKLFPSSDTVQLRIISGTPYAYDPSTSTKYALDKVCFTNGVTYNGELNASNGGGSTSTATNCDTTSTCRPGGTLPAKYDGNYLNWYFSTSYLSSGVTWSTQRIKPTTPATQTRSEIARSGAKDVIATLPSKTFVGLSTYYGGTNRGAEFLVDVNPLDKVLSGSTTQLQQLDSTIDSSSDLDPSGFTPLAEAIMDVGRYFMGTPGSATLTLWPNSSNPVNKTESDVFAHTPHAASGSGIDFSKSHITYSCQQNFLVLLTDGQPTEDRQVVSSTYTSLGSSLGDYDKDCTDSSVCDTNTGDLTSNTSGITFPSTNTVMSGKKMIYDEKKAWAYESGGSDYMDDVAKMLHDVDLDPSSSTLNNLNTYIIGFADKSVKNAPLIKETAANGGGLFLHAADASALKTAFAKATASILSMTSTASAVTFNTSILKSNTAVYQGLFNTGRWDGDIRAYPLNGVTGAIDFGCALNTTNCWSAAQQLNGQPYSSRTIFTYNTSDSPPQGVLFKTPSDYTNLGTDDIDAAELQDLCAAAAPGNPNPEGLSYPCDTTTSAWANLSSTAKTNQQTAEQTYLKNLISYLRGDRTQEGSSFRDRGATVLGDIVHSDPAYVGVPDQNWPDQPPFPTTLGYRYSDFVLTEQNRMGVVYAGSNDGMLHGFNATNGQEIMAFIPSSVFSSSANAGLHYLANPGYQHRYYVDGSPTVSDVYTYGRDSSGAETTTKAWRTVLLGTLRGGGAGLFLLDITDPSQFSSTDADKQVALWEFTNADNKELGSTFSKPTIAMMNNGRWAAVFGNGYNNGNTGGDGHAVLFIVYLDGGLDGSWSNGDGGATPDDYITIDTQAGSVVSGGTCASSGSNCDGLSTPALVDIDGNGTVDRIYAGDLLGNMWVFNVSSSNDQNWAVAYTKGNTPQPLFTAADPSGNPQPITVQPQLAVDPSNKNDIMVVFGTGQYVTNKDPSNTNLQTMYGVEDVNAMTGGTGKSGLTRSDLVQQTISTAAVSCSGGTNCAARTVSNTQPSNTQYGWYIDLEVGGILAGERVVVNPLIINGDVIFNTTIPNTAICSVGGGGWEMVVNIVNGGPTSAPVLDFNHDGIVNGSDVTTTGAVPAGSHFAGGMPTASTILSNEVYTGGTKSKCPPGSTAKDCYIQKTTGSFGTTLGVGRYSWRELRPPQ